MLGLFFGITACGGAQTQAPPPAGPAQAQSATASSPASATGGSQPAGETSIVASDTSGGVELSFAGSPDEVHSIRARVHALADQHNSLESGNTQSFRMHCPCAAIVPTGCCGMMGRTDSTKGSSGCCGMTGEHGMMGGDGHGHGDGCGMMGANGNMMHEGGGCCGGAMGQATPPPVGSTATVHDVDTGAVMSLAATKSSDADALRQQVHACVDHVQHGGCQMMQH